MQTLEDTFLSEEDFIKGGIEVQDDPAVLEREQAERAAAQQAQQQMQREQMDRSARMDEAMAAVQVEGFGMG